MSVVEEGKAALENKWLQAHELTCKTCMDLLRDIDQWLMKAYQSGQESMKRKKVDGSRNLKMALS